MAYCGKCGNQIEEGVKFCPSCGATLQVANPEAVQPEPQQPVQPEPTAEEKLADATKKADAFAQKLGNTADITADFDKADIESNKVMAVLAYFGILVIVPILAAKESKYARFHANQGLVLCISSIIYGVAYSILSSIILAISWRLHFLVSLIGLVGVVFAVLFIIGIINALNGRAKDLPIIGKFRLLK